MGLLVVQAVLFMWLPADHAMGGVYDFLRMVSPRSVFAVDPDLAIRKVDSHAHEHIWTTGEGWGFPPLVYHTKVAGVYDRADFFFPFGYREETRTKSTLKLVPLFENQWSKIPPFDGFSRCLTVYRGRSDLGQNYWGVFPFYGYTYRKFGVDWSRFVLFPLYYESKDGAAHTRRALWPIFTFANSPGRSTFKVWPLYGRDKIGADYFNRFALWPLFQQIDKYPGTPQASSYRAMPFPLYVRRETPVSCNTDILWPLISVYKHYPTGHRRYSFRPFFTYGYGGGIDELSLLSLYSSKTDYRKGTKSESGDGYVSVGSDEVFTERKFMLISTIQKRYRKGLLVFARYRFWPFAEYTWDLRKGSHLKVPEIISLKSDWWDLGLGRVLRFVDFRDTPVTKELSLLFGLTRHTELKCKPHIPCPPKPGDDGFKELIMGSFGKR